METGTEQPQSSVSDTLTKLDTLAKEFGTRTDKLISAKVAMLETPAKQGHFLDGSENHPDGKKMTELAGVREAIQVVEEGKASGLYVSSPENPMGNTVNKALMFVYGDRHIPGAQPKETVESRSKFLNFVQEAGSKSKEYKRIGKDWLNEEKPKLSVNYTRAIYESIRADIVSHEDLLEDPNSAVLIVNVGDDGGTELTLGDYAFITNEDDKALREIKGIMKNFSGREDIAVVMDRVPGNHDSDVNNKGIEVLSLLSDFAPPFCQEVGSSHLILSVDTNLGSTFWFESIARELKKNPELEPLAKKAIKRVEKQKQLVEETLLKAKTNNKDIIVIGHDEEIIRKLMPLEKSSVTHIISGHYHSGEIGTTKTTNEDGNRIERVRVGSSFSGMPGSDKEQDPMNFSIEIDSSKENPVNVKTFEIPERIKDAFGLN